MKLHQGLTIWLFLQRERKKDIPYYGSKVWGQRGLFFNFFFKEVFTFKGCIYLIKYVKQFKHLYLNIFYNLIHHAKVEFSVTWWFCDQETFLLFSTLKNVLLNIFVETVIFFFFFFRILWVESSKEQHFWKIFCNIMKVLSVLLYQFNVFLMGKKNDPKIYTIRQINIYLLPIFY